MPKAMHLLSFAARTPSKALHPQPPGEVISHASAHPAQHKGIAQGCATCQPLTCWGEPGCTCGRTSSRKGGLRPNRMASLLSLMCSSGRGTRLPICWHTAPQACVRVGQGVWRRVKAKLLCSQQGRSGMQCTLLAKGQHVEARCIKQRPAAPNKGWLQRLAAVDASGGASAMAGAALTGIGTTTRPSLRFIPPAPHTSSGMFCANAA